MEFENQPSADVVVAQPRSGGKKWILGGCGCLLVIVVACGGAGLWGYLTFMRPAMAFVTENIAYAESSPAVEERIGSPVTTGAPSTSQQDRQMTIRLPVSGPQGQGTIVIQGTIQDDFSWKRDDIYLEIDGERIALDPDAEFDIDIEGLDEP